MNYRPRRNHLGPSDGAILLALACQWLAPASRLRRAVLFVHRASADVLDAFDLVLDGGPSPAERAAQHHPHPGEPS